jgi:hypothetical protein
MLIIPVTDANTHTRLLLLYGSEVPELRAAVQHADAFTAIAAQEATQLKTETL